MSNPNSLELIFIYFAFLSVHTACSAQEAIALHSFNIHASQAVLVLASRGQVLPEVAILRSGVLVQEKYYLDKVDVHPRDKGAKKCLVDVYVQGLHWVLEYYYRWAPSPAPSHVHAFLRTYLHTRQLTCLYFRTMSKTLLWIVWDSFVAQTP